MGEMADDALNNLIDEWDEQQDEEELEMPYRIMPTEKEENVRDVPKEETL
jgi:hypothetical protein